MHKLAVSQPRARDLEEPVDRRALIGAALAGCFGLSACAPAGGSYRYKLTVRVRTPSGVVSASGVRSFSFADQVVPIIDTADAKASGEAVVVNLGARGVLFVTLFGWRANESPDMYSWVRGWAWGPSVALARNNRSISKNNIYLETPKHVRPGDPSVRLLRPEIPILIHFRDLNDPNSIEFVNPEKLEDTFGAGVELVDCVVSVTDKEITHGAVESKIPWIDEFTKEDKQFTIWVPMDNTVRGIGGVIFYPQALVWR